MPLESHASPKLMLKSPRLRTTTDIAYECLLQGVPAQESIIGIRQAISDSVTDNSDSLSCLLVFATDYKSLMISIAHELEISTSPFVAKLSLPKGFDAMLTPFVSFQHNPLQRQVFSKVEPPGIQGVLNLFEVAIERRAENVQRGRYRFLQISLGSKHFV
jgi:hypothetical protein